MRILEDLIRSVKRFPGVTALSVLTIALTLYVTGLFGLFYVNVSAVLSKIGERVQLVVFLEDRAADPLVEELRTEIGSLPGVTRIVHMSKEEALERFREELGSNAFLLDEIEENPLPASLEVYFDEAHRNSDSLRIIARRFEGRDGIELVDYARPWTEKLDRVRKLVGLVGLLTGIVVVVAAVLIIASNIKLALKARENEMEIVHLVGASDFTIGRPYLLEGFLKGVLGGFAALGLLVLTRRFVVTGLYPISFFTPAEITAGIAAGGLIGMLGAWLSVRNFLRSLLVLTFLLAPLPGLVPAARSQEPGRITEEIDQGKSELESIRKEIEENRKEAEKLLSKEKSISGEIHHLDKEIHLRTKLIDELGSDLKREQREFSELSGELRNAENRLEERKQVLARRLRAVYERGLTSPLEVLLGSKSFSGLELRLEYLSRVLAADVRLVEEIEDLRSEIARREREKGSKIVGIEKKKEEVDREKASLEAASTKKQQVLASVKKEKSKREKMIEELERQEKKLQDLIQKLEEERLLAEQRGAMRESTVGKARGRLLWPVRGKVVTKFGTIYDPEEKTRIPSQGIDISAGLGTPVQAVEAGKVEYADWWQTYGKMIIINHGGGFYTLYSHLNDISVIAGSEVVRGQKIGTVGNTGSLKGPALHFELRQGKRALDPLQWLSAR